MISGVMVFRLWISNIYVYLKKKKFKKNNIGKFVRACAALKIQAGIFTKPLFRQVLESADGQ